MKSLATKSPAETRAAPKPIAAPSRPLPTVSTGRWPMLQRQCACGGGCPRCQENLAIQSNLKISEPGDVYEQEADRIADEVMRMPESSVQRQIGEDKEDEEIVQREAISNSITTLQRSSAAPNQSSEVPEIVHEVLNSPGQPLDRVTRAFMEPRFGHDFSQVRVHTGGDAEQSASEVNAHAYTVGHNIVFGTGRYFPRTHEGQRLIAHELTHVVQQRAHEVTSAGELVGGYHRDSVRPSRLGRGSAMLQRNITIESTQDTSDPAHNLPVESQRDIVLALVQQLCSGFDVPASSPLRVEGRGSTCGDIQSGRNVPHTGCCCLCVLTAPAAAHWTIIVSQNESPHTDPSSHTVVINPSDSPIESLHWTSGGGTGERMINRPRVITSGHELCGHAALLEIGSHPGRAPRETSDVHDPTIRIERLIWGEQGLPVSEQRGLAGEGGHRGESVYRLTLDRFPLNASDPATLPSSEQVELQELKRFSSNGSWFIEVHGHSDQTGSPTVKQNISDRRATAVRDDLSASRNGSNYTFVKVNGHSDSQPITGASAERLRRVEVILSLFRAGVPTLPTSASPVSHVDPGTPTHHSANLTSGDICTRHLATQAWT